MQVFRPAENDAALVGFGVRVMLLSEDVAEGPKSTARRIAGFGGIIERETELYAGLEAVIDDPAGYGLLVIECDPLGGLEAGMKAFAMLGTQKHRLPVILISKDCEEQSFPRDRHFPIVLRAPVTAVAMRVGFEHALRDRLIWRAA